MSLDAAIAGCSEQIARAPGKVDAYLELSRLLLRSGRPGATQVLGEAIRAAGDAEGRGAAARALARLLAGLRPQTCAPRFERDLVACLEEPRVDAQILAYAAAHALLRKYPDGTPAEAAGDDPLWRAFLTRCINVHPAMEARLGAMRRALLARSAERSEALERAAEAVALQCFANEYLWAAHAEEMRSAAEAPAAFAAMYRAPKPGEALPDGLARVAGELGRERALAAAMPSLGAEQAGVSAAVRAQYEANPYPRWRAAPASQPAALRDVVAALPGVDAAALPEAPLELLIAGCGTGFEAIDLARIDPTLKITALDLSRASLAYGQRMAEAMEVADIAFVQGDILGLDPGQRSWDLIVSTGVLHHMDRPEAGLARLAEVLAPGGAIRLGLYSERARAPVRAAHALIRERGWTAAPEGIRAFRAHVLALPDEAPLAVLRQSEDFYSLSGCRDLLFHVREHRYTPPQLAALVEGAGLAIIGFDASPEAEARFREIHGNGDRLDLALWDAVEQAHPLLFAGMYQFWCQKPG